MTCITHNVSNLVANLDLFTSFPSIPYSSHHETSWPCLISFHVFDFTTFVLTRLEMFPLPFLLPKFLCICIFFKACKMLHLSKNLHETHDQNLVLIPCLYALCDYFLHRTLYSTIISVRLVSFHLSWEPIETENINLLLFCLCILSAWHRIVSQ